MGGRPIHVHIKPKQPLALLKGKGSEVSGADCEVSLSSGTFHPAVSVFLRKKVAGSNGGWEV